MRNFYQQKGVILIVAVLVLGVLLILGAYFLTFTITESKISQSQIIATKTYYLAEAGINEAIWKLKNDPEWKTNFETLPQCSDWLATTSRSDVLFPDSSYQIQIQNSSCARGEIIATAILNLPGGKTAQRIIKTKVFKALGSLTGDSAMFSGGSSENIDINASIINIYDSNLFSNHNLNISWFSNISLFDNLSTEKVEGKALAGGNFNLHWSSSLDATATCAKNVCQGDCLEEGCPPVSIPLPAIDFDSATPQSYKSKASTTQDAGLCNILCNGVLCSTKCVLTSGEFSDLLWQVGLDGTLTLNNEITYVAGGVELKGGRRLQINGALVADSTIDIGEKECWTNKGTKNCGFDRISVADPGSGKPSGILTKAKINFGLYSSSQNFEIVGLIYANDEISLVSMPSAFTIRGGILGRKISITSAWQNLNIYLDNDLILEGLWAGLEPPEGGLPPFSPVVTIEHWEESY